MQHHQSRFDGCCHVSIQGEGTERKPYGRATTGHYGKKWPITPGVLRARGLSRNKNGDAMEDMRERLFLEVYRGNATNHAIQLDNGDYTRVERAITTADVRRHFDGLLTLAVYPVRPRTNDCQFLAFDVDDRSKDTVAAILAALDQHGIGEQQRTVHYSGNKGWHITVFLAEWTPAELARRAGKAVLDTAGNPARVELFPKQDTLADDGVGNPIKLPEGWHRAAKRWCHYERDSRTWESVKRVARGQLERMAGHDRPEPAPSPLPTAGRVAGARGRAFPGSLVQRSALPPCMRTVLEQGVPDGMRHDSVFGLALTLYSKGYPEASALQMVREANSRCRPPLSDATVVQQVEGAYSGRYRGLVCSSDYLHDGPVTLCQSRCRVYRPEYGRAA